MTTTIAFTAAKGGQTLTTTTSAFALASARAGNRTLIVDLGPGRHVAPVLGIQTPEEGEVVNVNERLDLVVASHPYHAAKFITETYDIVVVDDGIVGGNIAADETYLVTQPCYLALRQMINEPMRNDLAGIIVHDVPERALTTRDVENVLGQRVVAVVAHSSSVARAVDAGLFPMRAESLYAGVFDQIVPKPVSV